MSLLDTFITLLFVSAMFLCLVFMCREWLRTASRTHSRTINTYTPVLPKVAGKKEREKSS